MLTLAMAVFGESADAVETGRVPADTDTILFLGDSITWAGDYVADFETRLLLARPGFKGRVLNLGLPSETVSGLSEEGHAGGAFPRPDLAERLDRVLERTKPDLVIACYGMNCGIYLPFDESRFEGYRKGIVSLRDAVLAAGADIILVTPPVHDGARAGEAAAGYDADVLERYGAWLLSMRAEGWTVIDLHGPMRRALDTERAAEPEFFFQADGVHPDARGHEFIAGRLIAHFGGEEVIVSADRELRGLVRRRMALLRDAWLTATGHTRPGLPEGLPLPEARAAADEITAEISERLAHPRE